MGCYPLRPPRAVVWEGLAKTTTYVRYPSVRMRSKTSVGSFRSTRQPAQVTSVQTVLCSVPRRAPFSNEPHSLSERHHEAHSHCSGRPVDVGSKLGLRRMHGRLRPG